MKALLFVFLAIFGTPYIQRSTATSGTVTIVDTGTEVTLIHEATLATTLTIALPANPVDGQRVNISSSGGITTLTMSTPVGSIISGITTMVAGGTASYIYSLAQTKWYKIV